MESFAGKVVVVTGAGRGLGKALALGFAARQAVVAANDLLPVNLDGTLAAIHRSGGQARGYEFDLAKNIPVQAMFDLVQSDWGRVDILINNAGVEPRTDLLEMDEWDWRRTLDVNLSAPFFTIQAAGRIMRQQGGGVILNIASNLKHLPGTKGRAAYLASKAGLIELTRAAARELAPYHIRVNAICPGILDTERQVSWGEPGSPALSEPERRLRLSENIPLARLGKLDEAVDLALFLCSDAAAYITGEAVHLDGGQSLA